MSAFPMIIMSFIVEENEYGTGPPCEKKENQAIRDVTIRIKKNNIWKSISLLLEEDTW